MTVLTHIDRAPCGAPTPEEILHDEIAKQHFLKYCDSGKCIRGAAHARKANWHEGLCLECAFNPYNMAAQGEPVTLYAGMASTLKSTMVSW